MDNRDTVTECDLFSEYLLLHKCGYYSILKNVRERRITKPITTVNIPKRHGYYCYCVLENRNIAIEI